jgi:DNA-binding CsgD family transcriptional regulator
MPELGDPISERELDVLNCLAEGASNREIAKQLSISPNTVKVHVRNIYTKLGVSSRTEATTVALQKGVLTIPGVEVGSDDEDEVEPEADSDGDTPVTPPLPDAEETAAEPLDGSNEQREEREPLTSAIAMPEAPSGRSSSRRLTVLFGLVAVVALVLAGLSLFDILGEAAPGTEPAATPDLFEEAEVGENWLMSRPLPEPRARMVVSAIGLNLYAIGGETAEGVDNSVLIYDTQQRQWSSGAPKLTAVADATAQVLAGEIYVVGGRLENGQATNAVEAYSPLNNGWRPLTALPQPIAGGLALTFGNQLYLFGGENSSGEVLDSAYVYDPAARQWQSLPSLQQARAFAAGGVLDGQLYVVGGSDGQEALASCERFDPLAEEWSTCPDLQQARTGAGAAAFLDKLYVLGGTSDDGVTVNEVMESGAEAWSEFAAPELEAGADWSYLGVTNVETRIYALGGNRQEQLSNETLIYRPLVYTFFIPAASAGEE